MPPTGVEPTTKRALLSAHRRLRQETKAASKFLKSKNMLIRMKNVKNSKSIYTHSIVIEIHKFGILIIEMSALFKATKRNYVFKSCKLKVCGLTLRTCNSMKHNSSLEGTIRHKVKNVTALFFFKEKQHATGLGIYLCTFLSFA
jgi:hypothetical protein